MKFVNSPELSSADVLDLLRYEYRITYTNRYTDQLEHTDPEEWWTIGDHFDRFTSGKYIHIRDPYIERNLIMSKWEKVE